MVVVRQGNDSGAAWVEDHVVPSIPLSVESGRMCLVLCLEIRGNTGMTNLVFPMDCGYNTAETIIFTEMSYLWQWVKPFNRLL